MAWATLGFGQEINFRGHLCRKPSITSHHTPKLVPLLFVPISPYPLYYIHLGCPPNSCCCYFFSKLCPTPYDPMDYSLPGSTAHGILQARILERVAISFSGGSSQPRDQTRVSCPGKQIFFFFLNYWATRKAQWCCAVHLNICLNVLTTTMHTHTPPLLHLRV